MSTQKEQYDLYYSFIVHVLRRSELCELICLAYTAQSQKTEWRTSIHGAAMYVRSARPAPGLTTVRAFFVAALRPRGMPLALAAASYPQDNENL